MRETNIKYVGPRPNICHGYQSDLTRSKSLCVQIYFSSHYNLDTYKDVIPPPSVTHGRPCQSHQEVGMSPEVDLLDCIHQTLNL